MNERHMLDSMAGKNPCARYAQRNVTILSFVAVYSRPRGVDSVSLLRAILWHGKRVHQLRLLPHHGTGGRLHGIYQRPDPIRQRRRDLRERGRNMGGMYSIT